jgi:hypothetical protein
MSSCLVNARKSLPWVRVSFVAVLSLLSSGWTCTAIIGFSSCPGAVPVPQIASLVPEAIPASAQEVRLSVKGSDFVPQSQIMWNGNALPTTFTDSRQLQTTITPRTFASFGGQSGSAVQISVISHGSTTFFGCPNGGSSGTIFLVIN